MELLGTIEKKPVQKNGKWDYIHVEYDTQDDFNDATVKIMDILYKKNAEGKCMVKDTKGNKYDLDVIHATFNVEENRITVYPYNCQPIQNVQENKIKTNNNKKSEK